MAARSGNGKGRKKPGAGHGSRGRSPDYPGVSVPALDWKRFGRPNSHWQK